MLKFYLRKGEVEEMIEGFYLVDSTVIHISWGFFMLKSCKSAFLRFSDI